MATRIDQTDITRILLKVLDGLREKGPVIERARLTARDGVRVLISGWNHSEGWSRGFSVHGGLGPSTHAKHDGGRYCGRGWHQRMVSDILEAIKVCRTHSVPISPDTASRT